MNNSISPRMSVIIVTPDNYETIRKTMQSLLLQTVREQLEIIIVAPCGAELGLVESELKDFLQFRVVEVEVEKIEASGFARAEGVLIASAPIVVFAEDHAYPAPNWAEVLINTHQNPWAAVAPAVCNANPGSIVSWVSYISGFHLWMDTKSAGVLEDLPWRNSSYKREILMDYGSKLEEMLVAESVMHWDLQRKGYQLYFQPQAKLYHLNFTHLFPMLQEQFYVGRLFAAARARHWHFLRRLVYVGGAPLIPLVKLWRILPTFLQTTLQHNLLPQILPPFLLGLVMSAVGEMLGFAFGFGNSTKQEITNIEFHADRHALESK